MVTDVEKERLERVANRPPLSEILNLHDFEVHHFPCIYMLSVYPVLIDAAVCICRLSRGWSCPRRRGLITALPRKTRSRTVKTTSRTIGEIRERTLYCGCAWLISGTSYHQNMVETAYPQGCHACGLVNQDPRPPFQDATIHCQSRCISSQVQSCS